MHQQKTLQMEIVSGDERSTEEKILNAARAVFQRKGFAGTRTRDIAEEAGINLALLNYYFRSKQKLFDLIMLESMQGFVSGIAEVVNDTSTTIEQKITLMASRYIDMFSAQPDIPLFVLSEMRVNPEKILDRINLHKVMQNSYLFQQLRERNTQLHPVHFMMNFMGMVIFPFAASPMIRSIGNVSEDEFKELMQERKKLVPKWIELMLNNQHQ